MKKALILTALVLLSLVVAPLFSIALDTPPESGSVTFSDSYPYPYHFFVFLPILFGESLNPAATPTPTPAATPTPTPTPTPTSNPYP